MNCDDLPGTGGPQLVLLALAAACLTAGVVLLCWSRSRRLGQGALLLLLAVGGGLSLLGGFPSPAQAADCSSADGSNAGASNSLTITQTSTMIGLAPGVAPEAIAGRVVNNGPDSTFVRFITVRIVSVTKAAGARSGSCDNSDYLIVTPRMSVGRTLRPEGGSATFTGASIGLDNSSRNQDACKGATIGLLYEAS